MLKRTVTSADNFTIVPNRWLRSTELSYKAKGLLAAIQSHQVGYELTMAQLVAQSRDGRDSVRSGLRELEKAGYLRREQVRNADGTVGYVWSLVDNPADRVGEPAPDATCENSIDPLVVTGAGFPSPVKPPTVSPTLRRPSKEDQLEDQKEDPPNPRQPAVQRRVARCRDIGGNGEDPKSQKHGTIDHHDLSAAAYVAEPPAATGGILDRLTDRERQRLVAAIANQLRTGITLKQVTETIADRNFDGIASIVAALIARINKLEPVPAKPQRRQVPECGQCQSRWVPVIDNEGHERWAPCPTCSPQAMAKAAA